MSRDIELSGDFGGNVTPRAMGLAVEGGEAEGSGEGRIVTSTPEMRGSQAETMLSELRDLSPVISAEVQRLSDVSIVPESSNSSTWDPWVTDSGEGFWSNRTAWSDAMRREASDQPVDWWMGGEGRPGYGCKRDL